VRPDTDKYCIEIEGLVNTVGAGTILHRDLNLKVKRDEVMALVGGSGSGKTQLVRVILGLKRPRAGQVYVFGVSWDDPNIKKVRDARRRMGMLFQNGALLTDLNVFENVAFPVREHARLPEPVLRRLVLMKLEAVGLRGAAELMPQELSGGMARRVALARAIVMDPEVLIYDEPFVGLDPVSMGFIVRLIRRLNDALGITSIVVTHDVQEVGTIADYSYLLAGGRAVAQGTTPQLQASQEPAVRQFMQGSSEGPVAFHYPAPDYSQQLLDATDLPAGRKP
jgi:phospholipid/cholesterol/gamma-HCH transport system ATP-binding protein